jgi:hypothetical protein
MDEGELKRRIALADGEIKQWNGRYRTFVAKDTVDLVLDEAHKDFPKLSDITGLIKEGESRLILETLEELHGKREKWFLKYFGQKEEAK